MVTMENEITTIKVTVGTRKKLRLLAAMMDKTIIEIVDQLASEALAKQTNENSESLQV